jgi:hypothetical protein
LQEEFKGKKVIAVCIHDDSAHIGEPSLVCEMMTRTMEPGKQNLALKYGDAKKRLYDSERTAAQTSIDSDIDVIRLPHAGTIHQPAGVNRDYLKFAGIFIGETSKVSEALQKAVAGPRSKLRNCMIPFLNSPLVSLQHRSAACILREDRDR